jgi:three-Cys-motif partner protein
MKQSGESRLNYIDGFCGPGRYKKGELGSPLVALSVAKPVASGLENVTFRFTDEREDRINHLKFELSKLEIPTNFNVKAINKEFQHDLSEVLDQLDQQKKKMAPSFVFIDPFGFAGLPYTLVGRVLSRPKCETFITFMVDSVNRFLNHPEPKIRQHMPEIFGTDECFQMNGIDALRDLYQKQLLKAAEFVRYFEMLDDQGRTIYFLFFATNNRVGHLKMKEAMWSVDPDGQFRFSDKTSGQAVLFDLSDQTELLWPLLYERFKGQTVLSEQVLRFVEDKTSFLYKHMRAALLEYEGIFVPESDQIKVADMKADGKRRKPKTYPEGTLITFPSEWSRIRY